MNSVSLKAVLANVDQENKPKEAMIMTRTAILSEVDRCANLEQELKDKALALREHARMLAEEARRIDSEREKLIGEVKSAMESEGFQKLPGQLYEIVLKACAPKLVVDRQPNQFDAEAYGYLVRQSWEWDTARLKAMLQTGSTIGWARLSGGSSITFKKKGGE